MIMILISLYLNSFKDGLLTFANNKNFFLFIGVLFFRSSSLVVYSLLRFFFRIFYNFYYSINLARFFNFLVFILSECFMLYFLPILFFLFYFIKLFSYVFFFVLQLIFCFVFTVLEYLNLCFPSYHGLNLMLFTSFKSLWIWLCDLYFDNRILFSLSSLEFLLLVLYYFYFLVFLDAFVYPYLLRVTLFLIDQITNIIIFLIDLAGLFFDHLTHLFGTVVRDFFKKYSNKRRVFVLVSLFKKIFLYSLLLVISPFYLILKYFFIKFRNFIFVLYHVLIFLFSYLTNVAYSLKLIFRFVFVDLDSFFSFCYVVCNYFRALFSTFVSVFFYISIFFLRPLYAVLWFVFDFLRIPFSFMLALLYRISPQIFNGFYFILFFIFILYKGLLLIINICSCSPWNTFIFCGLQNLLFCFFFFLLLINLVFFFSCCPRFLISLRC